MRVILESLDNKKFEMCLGLQRSLGRVVSLDGNDFVIVKTAGSYDMKYKRTGRTFAGLRVYRYAG